MGRFRLVFVLLATVVLPGLLAPTASAGDDPPDRTIGLPREGLSIRLPAEWTIEQYGDAILELQKGEAVVRIGVYDGPASQSATRTWSEGPDTGAHCSALAVRDGEAVFEIEAVLPDGAGLREIVDGILDSIDTTPYRYATRHVDWTAGWTITLPEGWVRTPDERHVARFDTLDGTCRLWVEGLEGLSKGAGGNAERDLDGWTELAWKEGLQRLQASEGIVWKGDRVVETLTTSGEREARSVLLGVDPGPDGEPRAWVHMLVQDGFRVLAYCGREATDAEQRVREATASFHRRTDPGPRVAGVAPTDRFPGAGGPPVVFCLPEGWTMAPGTNRMRLAQIRIADVEGVSAIVYWFGAGLGGSTEANLKRWREQMGGDDEGRTEKIEVADEIQVTLLDVKGSYAASGMGGPHGHGCHGASAHPGFRMLAAILGVPEGPLYVKFVGPEAVIASQEKAFRAWLASFRCRK